MGYDLEVWRRHMAEQGIPRNGQHNLTDVVTRGDYERRAYYLLLNDEEWAEWLAWFKTWQAQNPGR